MPEPAVSLCATGKLSVDSRNLPLRRLQIMSGRSTVVATVDAISLPRSLPMILLVRGALYTKWKRMIRQEGSPGGAGEVPWNREVLDPSVRNGRLGSLCRSCWH